MSKRHLLFLLSAAAALPSVASADELTVPLPKAYERNVRTIIKTMRESIDAEAEGASEFEVRRKADPVKEAVKEFVRDWNDNPRLLGEASHEEIRGVIVELSSFYRSAGQRSSLTKEVRSRVLQHLDVAESALPPKEEKKGLLDIFD